MNSGKFRRVYNCAWRSKNQSESMSMVVRAGIAAVRAGINRAAVDGDGPRELGLGPGGNGVSGNGGTGERQMPQNHTTYNLNQSVASCY